MAFCHRLFVAADGAAQDDTAYRVRIGPFASLALKAQEQRYHARDNGGGEARPAVGGRPAARHRAHDTLTRRQDPLGLIDRAPVAKIQRLALFVHGPHPEHRRNRRRHVQAFAAVVACGGHDEHLVVGAEADGVGQQRVRLVGGRQFAPADINNVGSIIDGLADGACQVDLRTGSHATVPALEHG